MQANAPSPVSGIVPWNGYSIDVRQIGAPIAVCDTSGRVVSLSPRAEHLLERLGVRVENDTHSLPASLWSQLTSAPTGQAVEWRPEEQSSNALLGCTRYALGGDHAVIFMREVSDKHAELSRRLHQQRLECTGRLVASIAHEVRTAVASVLYNADFLSQSVDELTPADVATTAGEIHSASSRLQGFVDGLLDFAKLGPPVSERVSVESVIRRAQALVRPIYREKRHTLRTNVCADSDSVLGNPLSIDQILVNLLVNAAESCPEGGVIEVSAKLEEKDKGAVVNISVQDNGPGIAPADAALVFEPFFTKRTGGTGLGLTTAREAARECGGDLWLEASAPNTGARFVVSLPAADRIRKR